MEPTNPGSTQGITEKQGLGLLLKAVSFCLPMVGIVLFFAMRKSRPDAARQAAVYAAFGVFAAVLLNILYSFIVKMNF